jgi:hypothetical protein
MPVSAPAATAPTAASAAPRIAVRSRTRQLPAPTPDGPPGQTEERGADLRSAAAVKRVHHVVARTGANWSDDGEYIVGKGRPPAHSRWQKGQSGNPRGPKPKEKLDPLAEFERELTADFVARVNGQDVRLNTGTFALQLLKAGAAKGTVKSQQILLELFLAAVRKNVERDETPEAFEWERQIIEQMLEEHGLPARPVIRRERQADPATNIDEGGRR